MKNLSELESKGLNKSFLLKHIDFQLQFAKSAVKAGYPGSFTSMLRALDNAIDDYSTDFLKSNANSDFDVDDFLSYIAAKVDEVREITQPKTGFAQGLPEFKDVIDEHLDKLQTVVQKIKAQRAAAAQEHSQLAHSI